MVAKRHFLFISFAISILLAFLVPPSIFANMDFMSRDLRMLLGLVVLLLLFLNDKKITIFDIKMFFVITFLLGVELMWRRSELSNILSYYAVVVFYILLFRTLKKNELGKAIILKSWINLGYLLSFSAIILFMLHQFTSLNTDVFNFSSHLSDRIGVHEYSFLGATREKNFGPFSLTRVASYFSEPQIAGFYFTINVLLSSMINKKKEYKWWTFFNVLAGMLTFSTTFYLAMLIFFTFQFSPRILNVFVIFLGSTLALLFTGYILMENIIFSELGFLYRTSYIDREIRFLAALSILKSSSPFNLLFGHGVGFTGSFDRGLGSGFFHVFVERGLVGLVLVLSMVRLFLQNNYTHIFIFILFLFAFTWYVNYIFWMGAVVLWAGNSFTVPSRVVKPKSGYI
jgi:hypothetical protein